MPKEMEPEIRERVMKVIAGFRSERVTPTELAKVDSHP